MPTASDPRPVSACGPRSIASCWPVRRALILLDDVAGTEQVRPLLPGRDDCLVVVTSRRSLAGLPSACQLSLDVFSADDAVRLLARTAGESRIEADLGAAARIADAVEQRPLALALTGRRIRATPSWTLTDHLERLAEHRENLRLDDGVEAVIRLSYDGLASSPRRLLRPLHCSRAGSPTTIWRWHWPGCHSNKRRPTCWRWTRRAWSTSGPKVAICCTTWSTCSRRNGRGTRSRRGPAGRRSAGSSTTTRYTASVAVAAVTSHQVLDGLPTPAPPRLTSSTTSSQSGGCSRCSNVVAADVFAAGHGWPDHACDLSSILHAYLVHATRPRDAPVLHPAAARTGAGAAKEGASGRPIPRGRDVLPPQGRLGGEGYRAA